MSSDSDHTPKPSKRIRCRISDNSESSDDSFVIKVNRKSRVQKVLSDNSSDEDVTKARKGKSLKRNNHISDEDEVESDSSASDLSSTFADSDSTSSEWESDWESSGDDSDEPPEKSPDSIKKRPKKITKNVIDSSPEAASAGGESDASDGQSEKCPICLLSFRKQQIGVPSACDHCFCLLCLTEWSKNVNTCPVDRQEFTLIHVKDRIDGEILNSLPVEPRNTEEEQIQEDPTYCEICHQCDREDRMLLCDGCDLGFHLECLTPPMSRVPMEEWFCSECSSQNNQNLAESVEMDLDELPDIIAEARYLGVMYGRTHAARQAAARDFAYDIEPIFNRILSQSRTPQRQRLIPRTRQSERVRATIRAGRNVTRNNNTAERSNTVSARTFDPDQPSTSSGFDSISENSRASGSVRPRRTATKPKSRKTPKRRKKSSRKTKNKNNNGEPLLQKVHIKEYNTDGEEQEIVTYVKVKSSNRPSSRKRKKRTMKRTRKKRKTKSMRRKIFCRLDNIKTVKKHLAYTYNMAKKLGAVNSTGFNINNQLPISQRSELSNARNRAGIPQLNLFGNNLALDYEPSGSDEDISLTRETDGINTGTTAVGIQRRGVSSMQTIRRRLALKTMNSTVNNNNSSPVTDLITNIINSQKLWHSKDKKITLKADGTLVIPDKNEGTKRNNDAETNSNIITNNNNTEIENTNNLTNINSADILQAPMYNNSRGGNNSNGGSGGGAFQGNYHNRNHNNHNRNDYGMRDSYSSGGQQNYGGNSGPPGGDFGYGEFRQPPPNDFRPNFDGRRPPPPPPGLPPFRGRGHFRGNNGRQRRLNANERSPGQFRPQNFNFSPINNSNLTPVNSVVPTEDTTSNDNTNVTQISSTTPSTTSTPVNVNDSAESVQDNTENSPATNSPTLNESVSNEALPPEPPADGEECDLYGDMDVDIQKPTDLTKINCDNENQGNTVVAMSPPPAPPSDLLDFEDNMKSDNENESDENDLVIDDAPKDSGDAESNEVKTDDKYDPFSVDDSDSNDSAPKSKPQAKEKDKDDDDDDEEVSKKDKNSENTDFNTLPLEPPPMPPELPSLDAPRKTNRNVLAALIGMDASDDDDDDDDDNSKSDCPNFSIYSSETMDVARHTEQELSQQIGPLEPPPLPPSIPDDDDIIVADVQACDLSDIPEPSDPYIESLQKERQTLSKIPPKKLSIDPRGKITFKIGNKFKLNNKLCNLRDELDDSNESSVINEQELKEKKCESVQHEKDKVVDTVQTKSDDSDNNKKECVDSSVVVKSSVEDNLNSSNEDVEKENIDGDAEKFDEIVDEDDKDTEDDKEAKKDVDDDNDNEDEDDDDDKHENAEEIVKTSTVEVSKSKKEDIFSDNEEDKSHDDEESNKIDLDIDQREENTSTELASTSDIELEKDKDSVAIAMESTVSKDDDKNTSNWESDGAYTPCKDEMPVKDKDDKARKSHDGSPYDSGLEPITPPAKDRSTDDLRVTCTTPIEYAGLGTEAISENDEPINFEDELLLLSKDQEMKDVEAAEQNKLTNKKSNEELSDSDHGEGHKRKKDKKDKSRDAEKNKENISSENHVAWKKISKTTKERPYREKGRHDTNDKDKDKDKSRDKGKHRDKSKEKMKRKKDENDKKKVKRKELPRYDVRKIVAEKPARPRKDEYGRDIRGLSRSLSRSRSLVRNTSRRSHSRERMSRSYSPRINLRNSRSWSRAYQRSWSQNRSPSYKQSGSRLRKKSLTRDRRSLSRRRSRSPVSRRSRRSSSNQRSQRRNKKKSITRKHRSRSRSWSRSRSRSRSRLRSRTRSRSRSRTRSRSRSRTRSRLRMRSRTKSRSKSRSRSRGGMRKKEKLKKHKSRDDSRRRKRSRSKSPIMKAKLNKKRSKRKLNVSNTNASHSFTGRSRSRERSYSRERNHSRNWNKVNDKIMDPSPFSIRTDKDQINAAAPVSWSAQWTPSWSRSRSHTPIDKQRSNHILQSHGWSPSSSIGELAPSQSLALPPSSPPSQSSLLLTSLGNTGPIGPSSNVPGAVGTSIDGVVSPKNLTVILRNKDASKNKKKKDKRREAKERKKSRDMDRRKASGKRNRTPPPSKEVFASGDNILVSVCFNNDNLTGQSNIVPTLTDTLPLLTTAKRRRRDPIQIDEPSKKPKKDKAKEKRSRSPKLNKRDKKRKSKAAEIAASKKPVAVIDLDQSPFREQTLSPQDVIVLSDDDNANNDDCNKNTDVISGNNINVGNNVNVNSCINNSVNIGDNGNVNVNVNDNNVDNIQGDNDEQMAFAFSLQQGEHGKQLNKGDDKGLQQQDHQLFQQQYKQHQKRSISSELDQFMMQGPKTPPEPQVKFSINKQPNSMRPMMLHPLFDIGQDDEMEMDDRINGGNGNRGTNKASRGSKEKGDIVDMFADDDEARIESMIDDEMKELMRKEQEKDANKGEDSQDINAGQDGKKDSKVQRDDGEEDGDDNDDDDDDARLEAAMEDEEEEMMLEKDDKRLGENLDKDDDGKKRKDDDLDRDSDKKSLKNDNKGSETMEGGKIGPNTPPEPPISPLDSPDAYDPFDPTKSRSPTPSVIEEPISNEQKHGESTTNEKSESDKPKVISMVTIKRALSPDKNAASPIKSHDPTKALDQQLFKDHTNQLPVASSNLNCFTTINPVLATVAAAVQRSGIFNLNNPQTGFNLVTQRNACQINRLSPSGQLKQQRANDRVPQLSNVFANAVKNLPVNSRNSKQTMGRNSSLLSNNGGDLPMDSSINDISAIDTSSPYSPGSSLSDGIFDPPSPGRNHLSPPRLPLPSATGGSKNISSNNVNNSSKIRSDKKDLFDALFESSPVNKFTTGKLRIKKSTDKRKKSSNSKIGVRMDENQLQILDDLPSSAVEMQVKDKFLKKLNRQERVVEEVKLVLKPHYTKKHVTKDEYKDIMRKAVPKICHNKTGEINPKKIAQLIEAYVKRCRSNKRKNAISDTGKSAVTAKTLRPSKNIWS